MTGQDEMVDAGNSSSFAALPVPLLHDILFRLPVDQRLLLSAVSRGLHAAVSATVLWQDVDLNRGSGVRAPSAALLRAVTAKAAGTMVSLHVTNVCHQDGRRFLVAVRKASQANSASLRRLSAFDCEDAFPCCDYEAALHTPLVEGLLTDAPCLEFLETDVWCSASTARRVLRNERPFGVLRARRVCIGGAYGAIQMSVERDFAVRAVSFGISLWLTRILVATPGAAHEC